MGLNKKIENYNDFSIRNVLILIYYLTLYCLFFLFNLICSLIYRKSFFLTLLIFIYALILNEFKLYDVFVFSSKLDGAIVKVLSVTLLIMSAISFILEIFKKTMNDMTKKIHPYDGE